LVRRASLLLVPALSLVLLADALSFAGPLGHKIADSGSRADLAFVDAKIRERKRVYVKETSSPPQQMYGTYSVNCFKDGLVEVYHRDGAWDGYGTIIRRVGIPNRAFDKCFITPLAGLNGENAAGFVRVRVYVKPARHQ
jgi:hypothetical protein